MPLMRLLIMTQIQRIYYQSTQCVGKMLLQEYGIGKFAKTKINSIYSKGGMKCNSSINKLMNQSTCHA